MNTVVVVVFTMALIIKKGAKTMTTKEKQLYNSVKESIRIQGKYCNVHKPDKRQFKSESLNIYVSHCRYRHEYHSECHLFQTGLDVERLDDPQKNRCLRCAECLEIFGDSE